MSLETLRHCPDCGTPLAGEPWARGLCLSCLGRLAMDQPSLHEDIQQQRREEATTLDDGSAPVLSRGDVLGNRYQIRSRLGGGGMGEVWRAFDLKLRVDVALKALHPRLVDHDRALETLRQEVRTAREVVSPNVCRVFDLVEIDGQELVSMEYVDGTTLQQVLEERSPLDIDEARDVAAQLLAGLEAIHGAGLVHRDVKPENVMLTRAGRVVVMDFGIARALREDEARGIVGTVAGTPAYMSPEQARGEALDARADVFAAGLVLAEMIDPEGTPDPESRRRLWERCHQEPPALAETPWAPILRRAVAPAKELRPASAAELARALEELTARALGDDGVIPYPGLAAFTAEDTEYFFGRELEVEGVWKELRRSQLLALVGPSGAGKSSFVHAGLLPAMPPGWRALVTTPGSRPFQNLARGLVGEVAGDTEAMDALLRFEEPDVAVSLMGQWRRQQTQGLVVVDQFEELFTQNPSEVQKGFAELLGRLALEADVHVLLSMRDDFLFHCSEHEALTPVFSAMTPLRPLSGSALRRALVQPALKCGYRFEDDALVDQMLAEVEGERGALPLLAFAAAQLWQRRDREQGLLIREAYEEIGGVAGALARHAEATLERIGAENLPIVRELFRHLVTAQRTRAVWDREELLSTFEGGGRGAAESALAALIDARLLTSYELQGDDEEEPHHRVEIIHESLLRTWPRLVRWQSQDEDSAHMLDQLRQAAHLWDERGRSPDLLWTGTSYKDFELWRERYPGGLSAQEEAFARAMTRHAERRRRRRRIAAVSAFAFLMVVLSVVGGLWRRSEIESQRAEAANLFTQAQTKLEFDDHPTGALAFAMAALEHHDTLEIRRLIVEALWRGPTELRIPFDSWWGVDFGPDGRWLAASSVGEGGAALWPSDGGPPTLLEGSEESTEIQISPRGDVVANTFPRARQSIGLWTVPDGRFLRSYDLGEQTATWVFHFSPDGERVATTTENFVQGVGELTVRSWPVAGGEPELIARIDSNPDYKGASLGLDASGRWLSWSDGSQVMVGPVDDTGFDRSRVRILPHDERVLGQAFDTEGRRMATLAEGVIRVWSLEDDPPRLLNTLRARDFEGADGATFSPSGSLLASAGFLWDLEGPTGAAPLRLRRPGGGFFMTSFHPSKPWIATSGGGSASLWPLNRQYPLLLPGAGGAATFTRDGRSLIVKTGDELSLWPLHADGGPVRFLYRSEVFYGGVNRLALAPDESFVATTSQRGHVRVHPLDGGPVRELEGFTDVMKALAVDAKSRLVAAGSGPFIDSEALVRVWDLNTGEARILDAGDGEPIQWIRFLRDGDVLVSTRGLIRRWDLSGSVPEVEETMSLATEGAIGGTAFELSADESRLLFFYPEDGTHWVQELATGERRELVEHRSSSSALFADAAGQIVVSTDEQGAIRVGRVDGGAPHLLIAPEPSRLLAVSPDGRWIAAMSGDDTYLWPMPGLDERPIHTLPRDELLAKLRALVNLRAVEDPEAVSGWKLEIGSFPGWEEVPTW